MRLLEWYAAYRDDEWEHRHGIKLEALEHKPGWTLVIDTAGTELAEVAMLEQRLVRSETDWLQWSFEPGSFRATCGAHNLGDLIARFFEEYERIAELYRRP